MNLEERLHLLENKIDQLLNSINHSCLTNSRVQATTPPKNHETDQLVDLEVAADFLGISAGHLRNLQWAEKLPHYRIGTCVRFQINELKEYFRRKPRR